MSELQGGKFGHGFLAAGATQAFAPLIGKIDAGSRFSATRVLASAILGGTVSRISGGKFANGAITGAFSRLFNDEVHFDDGQKGANPDIGGYSLVPGEYFNENGDLVSVDLQVYGNGNEALISADGLTSYSFDHQTGLLVNPLAMGAAESICLSCYLIGGGSVKFGWGALKSWVTGTLGGPKVGHRLFTATRKNGTWNTGKHRFGWSGKNGSDTYQFMYRYKQHHIPTGIKTTRTHPSGG